MLFGSKQTTEEKIIEFLIKKNQTAKSLKKLLAEESIHVTIQAIYKLLRALILQEIIIKHGTGYSLSEEWRSRSLETLSKNNNPFELAEGERISLDLSSLVHLDQQWKNIILPLHEAHPNDPTFFYNPHDIWIHLNESRKESEYRYYQSFTETKTHAFYLIGGDTLHDHTIKKDLRSDFVQISIGTEYFPKTDYPTIFGSYVITTRLSPRLADEIESCYRESPNTGNLEELLRKIGIEKKKAHLIIERNTKKAKKLRKKMSRDFHISPELIKKFDLF